MPYLRKSSYKSRPFYMINAHWETIIPSALMKGPKVNYLRERLELDDGDFLDVDFLQSKQRAKKCMIITHGLEGGSDRFYVKRTADYFHSQGWDIIAWNCRSCSGEINRLPRFYHHGETGDLSTVVDKSLEIGYDEVVLFGYSMGGSMSLKYLGEREVDSRVKGGITFSVPCNLRNSADVLKRKENQIYEKRFLSKLVEKMKIKSATFPEQINIDEVNSLTSFDEFHEKFTAPLHGFENSQAFFEAATCDRYLGDIKVPIFIGNALNDPMLGDKCYPISIAEKKKYVFLETPKLGGHTGFTIFGNKYSWMELRAGDFIQSQGW
ncbi:MAG: alpha/beta fold hydrolase [Cyclobacteriaceae bacterium]